MEKLEVSGLELFYAKEEQEAAEILRSACEESVRVIGESWGLKPPAGCRVYVMTSWLHFAFHSAPIGRRVLLALFFPLWAIRASRMWSVAGGWMQGYGQTPAVGVKPHRLLKNADRSMGDVVFIRDADPTQEVKQIACHELTHAFTNLLRLPTWLHEGLAMVTVDRLRGSPSVRIDSLDIMERSSMRVAPTGYPRSVTKQKDSLVYLYVRGYWLTRYMNDTRPELMRELLTKRRSHEDLEDQVSAAYDKSREDFWANIDALLVSHFRDSP